MGDTAYIFAPVNCDFCKEQQKKVEARYDGATKFGPWAYMCDEHFAEFGLGLGTGRGQHLIVGDRPSRTEGELSEDELTTKSDETESAQPKKEEEEIQLPKMDWGNLHP